MLDQNIRASRGHVSGVGSISNRCLTQVDAVKTSSKSLLKSIDNILLKVELSQCRAGFGTTLGL